MTRWGWVPRRAKRAVRRTIRSPSTSTDTSPSRSPQRPHAADDRFSPNSARAQTDAVRFVQAELARQANQALEARVRQRLDAGATLRVSFIVSERAKWNTQGVLELLAERGAEVGVTLMRMERQGESEQDARTTYAEERRFFSELGVPVTAGYDWDAQRHLPPESIDADVVFLQQPWRMEQFPRRLLGRALTSYLHYGIALMDNTDMHYAIPGFHPYLWRHYAPTEYHRDMHLEVDPSAWDRSRVVGYPKLDRYLDPPPTTSHLWSDTSETRHRVVVAPHHSVGPTGLKMSTFAWSGPALLSLARGRADVSWLYKPHPRLRHAVVTNDVMSRADFDAYERSWAQLPNVAVYTGPDYLDAFRTSDALITDSGSFLAEYAPTGRPIIRLRRGDSIGFNRAGRALAASTLDVWSPEELPAALEAALAGPSGPERRRSSLTIGPACSQRRSSAAIVDDILTALADPEGGSTVPDGPSSHSPGA